MNSGMKVAIIKYNAGNIRSVDHALKRVGVDAVITDDHETILAADRVIFPGVGEAASTMEYLKERELDTLLKGLSCPVLGICLGQQLMCSWSEEGDTTCIGIFDQPVRHLPKDGLKVRRPRGDRSALALRHGGRSHRRRGPPAQHRACPGATGKKTPAVTAAPWRNPPEHAKRYETLRGHALQRQLLVVPFCRNLHLDRR